MKITRFLMGCLVFLSACTQTAKSPTADIAPREFTLAADRMSRQYYNGDVDDLATAGLGLDGLRDAAPAFTDPVDPGPQELRRAAIYHNYRNLLAVTEDSGYGALYARHWDLAGGKVSGYEYIAPLLFGDSQVASVVMLQVPDRFDPHQPCLIATASSGSRGIYGAVGVVGVWGLHQGCAVVHTDKGTGTGFHWLSEDQANTLAGNVTPAGEDAHFRARDVAQYARRFPHRVASKHAHSQRIVDQYWGRFVLQAIDFAFTVLNRDFSRGATFDPANTLVVGAGISNGAASVLRAAEQDQNRRFDGIVLSEPAINLPAGFSYLSRSNEQTAEHRVRSLPDIAIRQALYLPCAARFHDRSALSPRVMPVWQSRLETRCKKLADSGLLKSASLPAQSREALEILYADGLLPDSAALPLVFTTGFIWEAYLVNYVNNYGAYSVSDDLCHLSYAFTNAEGEVVPTPQVVKKGIFANSGGIIPVGGLSIVNNVSANGARSLIHSRDENAEYDLAFDNFRCLREIIAQERLREGIATTEVSGDLNGLPAIILHGRADNFVQVKNTSRAYLALNRRRDEYARLRYYEILNAQHFDSLVALPAFKAEFVPMQPYFEEALELMLAHLNEGRLLPASRVVKTWPPETAADRYTRSHVPPLDAAGAGSLIRIEDGSLVFAD